MTKICHRDFLACLGLVLLALAGCAPGQRTRVQVSEPPQSPTLPPPPQTPPPVRQPPVVLPPAVPPAQQRSEPTPAPNQAVVALLDTVDKQAQAGNLDNAAAVLERALRLEPQNPLLWHRLAALRMQQHQYAQAASLAAKSNALAGNNRQLQANNWYIIAQAKEQLGDAAAARTAREKARQLQ